MILYRYIYYVVFQSMTITFMYSEDVWEEVPCNTYFEPENCDFNEIPRLTVEDFERCGPALLDIISRNYYLGAAGRKLTYNNNKEAYKRIKIVPKMLRDVSNSSLSISTLGQKLSFPIGFSPVALQNLAHPLGEIATVQALSNISTVMILSSYGSTTIEDLAATKEGPSHLWMQVYIFKNRTFTRDIVSRAERQGFEAIVVTVDDALDTVLSCNARAAIGSDELVNLPGIDAGDDILDKSVTFADVAWLRSITTLPIVAKGILSASDARRALSAGVEGILVSNHGGRQMDGAPATIEVLSEIVEAVKYISPQIDVYVDGGIRNGWDVYKAIALGAKMVFLGRPIIFGLAKEGVNGVRKVLNIIRTEFEEAMLLSGASNPSQITKDTVIEPKC